MNIVDSQLKKGLLEICVLSSLSDEPSYGYKIINTLSGVVDISESTLYTILKRLEANECLSTKTQEENGRLRKYYIITPDGKVKIDEFLAGTKEFHRIISFIERNRENKKREKGEKNDNDQK